MEKLRTRKRLIVHIGAPKCGSSAIQVHLALNKQALAERGVLIPSIDLDLDGKVEGHQIWFIEDLKSRTDAVEWLSDRLTSLAEHMDANGMHMLIMSAENISGYPWLANIFVEASTVFDVSIVLYVRRQDDFITSAWQQWGLKEFNSFDYYIHKEPPILDHWGAILAPWELTIGSKQIILRPFRRDMLIDGDVVADFFTALGISQSGLMPFPQAVNPSYDEHLGDLAHRIRDVFDSPHDFRFFQVMENLLGEKCFKSRRSSHLMSLAERREFLARYDADNAKLRDRYLPEFGDRPLFEPPEMDAVALLSESEKLRAENGVLMRSVYALAQRVEALDSKLADMTALFKRVEAIESETSALASLVNDRENRVADPALGTLSSHDGSHAYDAKGVELHRSDEPTLSKDIPDSDENSPKEPLLAENIGQTGAARED